MKIIHDKELKYKESIQNNLRAYNKTQTGEKVYEEYYIYLFEDNALQGALNTSMGWDYVSYEKMFYHNIDILKALHNEAIIKFKDSVVGFQYNTHVVTRLNDLYTLGFTKKGELLDFPKGHTKTYLTLQNFNVLPTKEYRIITNPKPIEEYETILTQKVDEYNKQNNIDQTKSEYNFVALDDDKFAGGVYAVLQEDYMYISLLLVKEEYRKQNLGTKLMKKVEDLTKNIKVENIYLGTASFQAFEFYQKLGYKLVMSWDDYPKGHQVYTLHKRIKIDN